MNENIIVLCFWFFCLVEFYIVLLFFYSGRFVQWLLFGLLPWHFLLC